MTLREILETKRTEYGAFEVIEEACSLPSLSVFKFVNIHNSILARIHCDIDNEIQIIVEEIFEHEKLVRRTSKNITETFVNGTLIAKQIIEPDGSSCIERFFKGERGADIIPALSIISPDGKAIVESWYEGVREGDIINFGLRHRRPRRNSNGVFEYEPAHIERNFERDEQREYHFRANELSDPPSGSPAVVVRSAANPTQIFSQVHFSGGKLGHPSLPAISCTRDGFSLAAHVHNGILIQPKTDSAIKLEKDNIRISYDINADGSPQSRTVSIDLSSLPDIPDADKEQVVEYLKESLRGYMNTAHQNSSQNTTSQNQSDKGSWSNFNSI